MFEDFYGVHYTAWHNKLVCLTLASIVPFVGKAFGCKNNGIPILTNHLLLNQNQEIHILLSKAS